MYLVSTLLELFWSRANSKREDVETIASPRCNGRDLTSWFLDNLIYQNPELASNLEKCQAPARFPNVISVVGREWFPRLTNWLSFVRSIYSDFSIALWRYDHIGFPFNFGFLTQWNSVELFWERLLRMVLNLLESSWILMSYSWSFICPRPVKSLGYFLFDVFFYFAAFESVNTVDEFQTLRCLSS